MTRRPFLFAALATPLARLLRAQTDDGVKALFQAAIDDLTQRKTGAFWLLFDSAMPGYKQMRRDSQALVDGFDVTATVEFTKIAGSGATRAVQMDWGQQMVSRTGARSHTTRHVQVQCRVESKNGQWLVAAFAPLSLFTPPDVDGAWETIAAAAGALAHGGFNFLSPEERRGNAVEFLSIFDRSMPGYDELRSDVIALARDFQVDSAVELVSDEGGDTRRTLKLDWDLGLISPMTDVSRVHRHETVTLQMSRNGKKWRVTALEPLALFAVPKA